MTDRLSLTRAFESAVMQSEAAERIARSHAQFAAGEARILAAGGTA
jgi:hypothetical protein